MSVYDDIIGNAAYYDIIGRHGGDFNGQFNQQGGPMPNWGPVPGYGPNIGPMGLAFDQETEVIEPDGTTVLVGPNGGSPLPPPGWGPGWGPGPGWGGCGFPGVVPNGNAVASLIAAKHSKLVAPRTPARARREIVGFEPVCLGPCETVTIETEPQVLFRPDRLLIPSNIAFQLLIRQIKFGKWNLFANGGAVPAAAFIETAEDTKFLGDTVQPSGKISITVQNTSNSKVEFSAMMWGDAIE